MAVVARALSEAASAVGGRAHNAAGNVLRLAGLDTAPSIVVCNEAHRFLVAEQLRRLELQAQAIILEPVGRNTAPAIALAALHAAPDALLLVLPADHVIRDVQSFHAAVRAATAAAQAGKLVTFGIVPTAPETGYGYIKQVDGQRRWRLCHRSLHREAGSRAGGELL